MTAEPKRLTIEQLRSYKGCEHYTDEEAAEIIDTLEQLSFVFFKLYKKEQEIKSFASQSKSEE